MFNQKYNRKISLFFLFVSEHYILKKLLAENSYVYYYSYKASYWKLWQDMSLYIDNLADK
jgi:hypothetical protein